MIQRVPYLILGTYMPEVLDAEVIGADLTKFTMLSAGLVEPHGSPWKGAAWNNPEFGGEVRINFDSRGPLAANHADYGGWHRDGYGGSYNYESYGMIVWANMNPTQLLYQGQVLIPEPYQIMLFDNNGPKHRQEGSWEGRYFYRRYVKLAPPYSQILASTER